MLNCISILTKRYWNPINMLDIIWFWLKKHKGVMSQSFSILKLSVMVLKILLIFPYNINIKMNLRWDEIGVE